MFKKTIAIFIIVFMVRFVAGTGNTPSFWNELQPIYKTQRELITVDDIKDLFEEEWDNILNSMANSSIMCGKNIYYNFPTSCNRSLRSFGLGVVQDKQKSFNSYFLNTSLIAHFDEIYIKENEERIIGGLMEPNPISKPIQKWPYGYEDTIMKKFKYVIYLPYTISGENWTTKNGWVYRKFEGLFYGNDGIRVLKVIMGASANSFVFMIDNKGEIYFDPYDSGQYIGDFNDENTYSYVYFDYIHSYIKQKNYRYEFEDSRLFNPHFKDLDISKIISEAIISEGTLFNSTITRIISGDVFNCIKIEESYCKYGERIFQGNDERGCEKIPKCIKKFPNGNETEILINETQAIQIAEKNAKISNYSIKIIEYNNDEIRGAYELRGIKNVKFLSLFRITEKVKLLIDIESGEVVSIEFPWWDFLVSDV